MAEVFIHFNFNPLRGFTLSRTEFEAMLEISREAIRSLPNVGKSTRFQSSQLVPGMQSKGVYRDALGNIVRR